MAIVYVTPKAEEEARRFGVQPEQLAGKYKERPFEEALRLFEIRHPYLYDRLGKDLRIVGKVEHVDGVAVICLLGVLKRGDRKFKDFIDDPASYGAKFEEQIDLDGLKKSVELELREEQPPEKQSLPDHLRTWLHPFDLSTHADQIIMESADWVKSMQTKGYRDYWLRYYELVWKALDEKNDEPLCSDIGLKRIGDPEGLAIYFARCLTESRANPGTTIDVLYLADAAQDHKTRQRLESDLPKKFEQIDWNIIVSDLDDVARHASRGYPAFLLADKEVWRQIEQDEGINLALSGEESQLLGLVRGSCSGSGEATLPVFINGRAGSGKSTLLYYLFSDYARRKILCGQDVQGDLLFITYSERLVESARSIVHRLLKYRHDFLVARDNRIGNTPADLGNCFQPFLDFILNQVPDEHLIEFPPNKFIDYPRFKQLFLRSKLPDSLQPHGLRVNPPGVSADLSWHVIRTFIKGYSYDGYLDPESYDEISRKEQSVSAEVYKSIYSEVWEKWYKRLLEEHGFWDSQDLVRRVLSEGWIQPQYAVVFCDEAQDFTRIEIDLILKLLIYRQYDLGPEKNVRLPFALAGDPFQTLNPTGFRWSALKAAFYEEIMRNLDPEARGLVGFRYEELSYNYRSVPQIVKLGNLLLLWREVLLKMTDARPQQPWHQDLPGMSPALFVLGDSLSEQQFEQMTHDAVVIVPCEEGREQDYVTNDLLLSKRLQNGSPVTVLSPMSAKGLEFAKVILYKFGDACPQDLLTTSPSDEAERLEREYFLNKLYVAVTRAMKYLFIVDTPRGMEVLWSHTTDAEQQEKLQMSSRPEKWKGTLAGTLPIRYSDIKLLETENPLEIAQSLQRGGREQHNPYLLRQAQPLFKQAGQPDHALCCEAEALELEEQYEAAGDLFDKLTKWDAVERCYWKGMCWKKLSTWYASHPLEGNRLYRLIVKVIMVPDNVENALCLARHVEQMIKDGERLPIAEPQFQEGIVTAIQSVGSCLRPEPAVQDLDLLAVSELLKGLRVLYRRIGLDTVAQIHFHAGQYEEAVRAWEELGQCTSKDYYCAKAEITPYPHNLEWWDRAGKPERVIQEYQEYEQGGAAKVVAKDQEIVARSYSQLERYDRACEIYVSIKQPDKAEDAYTRFLEKTTGEEGDAKWELEMFQTLLNLLLEDKRREDKRGEDERFKDCERIYKAIARHRQSDHVRIAAEIYMRVLLKAKQWKRAIAYTSRTDIQGRGEPHRSINLPRIKENRLPLQALVIKELAYQIKDLSLQADDKDLIAEYVRQVTEEGVDAWKGHVSLVEMATVFERSHRRADTLRFYETLERENLTEAERRFARQRWLKTKQKQVDWEQMQLQRPSGSQDTRQLEARKNELNDKSKLWQIELEEINGLPEYPDPQDLQMCATYKVEWSESDLTCRIACISKGGEESQFFVNVTKGEFMKWGDLDPEYSTKTEGATEFKVPAWGLRGIVEVGKWVEFKLGDKNYRYEIG